jgi:GntR family transcriptional regulator/MocR family aminotransferase
VETVSAWSLVSPSHQFPSGAVMSLARRMALLDYAAERGCWVVEDDYDGEFRYDGVAIPALRSLDVRDRVIYVGSFSKVLFPGLRLGYVVCPSGLRGDLVAAKMNDDLGCGSIEQAALAALMQSGAFDRHLRHAAAELRRRRAALLDGLREHCSRHLVVNDSRAGMHVVGWLPGWTSRQVEALAAHAAGRAWGCIRSARTTGASPRRRACCWDTPRSPQPVCAPRPHCLASASDRLPTSQPREISPVLAATIRPESRPKTTSRKG